MANFGNRYGGERMTMFPPAIKWLLGINAALFLLGFLPFEGVPQGMSGVLRYYGALWPIASENFAPWQYITYMFLHGGLAHIAFNMFALWMFGMEIEQLWGTKRFLAFYALCGLFAGLLHSVVTMIASPGEMIPTIGASGAIMGVMIAFGMVFPDRIVMVSFFLPLRARIAVLLFVALDLYLGISATSDGVAHFAHLGGALAGFLIVQFGGKMTLGKIFDRIPGFGPRNAPVVVRRQIPEQRPQPAARAQVIDINAREVLQPRQDPASMRLNFGDDQEKIDRILDKISRSGYQSLSDEEKIILQEASRRM